MKPVRYYKIGDFNYRRKMEIWSARIFYLFGMLLRFYKFLRCNGDTEGIMSAIVEREIIKAKKLSVANKLIFIWISELIL